MVDRRLIPLVVSSGMVAIAIRQPSPAESSEEGKRIGRLVGIASGAEGALIGLAIIVLINIYRVDLVASIMATIVGLHFFALAYWMPRRLYYATGALLIAIGICGVWVANVNQRILFTGIGCALVLWLTCLPLFWCVVAFRVKQPEIDGAPLEP
jgi:hypothetical protein